jgi:hypothetical protein
MKVAEKALAGDRAQGRHRGQAANANTDTDTDTDHFRADHGDPCQRPSRYVPTIQAGNLGF